MGPKQSRAVAPFPYPITQYATFEDASEYTKYEKVASPLVEVTKNALVLALGEGPLIPVLQKIKHGANVTFMLNTVRHRVDIYVALVALNPKDGLDIRFHFPSQPIDIDLIADPAGVSLRAKCFWVILNWVKRIEETKKSRRVTDEGSFL